MNQLEIYRKLTRQVTIIDGEIGQQPITKFGGVPWWPANVSRPVCDRNHSMTFIAQILLSDLPDPGQAENSLLSFHYCIVCAYEGRMSHGWTDAKNRGYDVRLFERPERFTVDVAGLSTKSIGRSGSVRLTDAMDFPNFEDLPSELHDLAEFGEFEDEEEEEDTWYENITETKVGGWPSWVQSAQWPVAENERMMFVAQVSSVIGVLAPWGGGGYAYLFVTPPDKHPRRAELSILTT